MRWFFDMNAFSRSVYANNQVQFYANALPAGMYVVIYEARASIAAKFEVLPAHAFAVIMLDIFSQRSPVTDRAGSSYRSIEDA